jgi:hypothetical protein
MKGRPCGEGHSIEIKEGWRTEGWITEGWIKEGWITEGRNKKGGAIIEEG